MHRERLQSFMRSDGAAHRATTTCEPSFGIEVSKLIGSSPDGKWPAKTKQPRDCDDLHSIEMLVCKDPASKKWCVALPVGEALVVGS